ncbi:MAG: ATPase, T2SS/T4P/T4SS family [Patescibacteria group bacterium]
MAILDNTQIDELKRREEEELASILSQKYGAKYLDLTRVTINSDALRLIPEKEARTAEVAAFDIVGRKVSLAMRSPQGPRIPAIKALLAEQNMTTEAYMVSTRSLEAAWKRYKDLSFAIKTTEGSIDISSEDLVELIESIKTVADIQKSISGVEGLEKAHRISRIVEAVMAGGFAVEASDIHIEPEQMSVRLRYRLDGVLHDVARFDHVTHQLLLSRVKLLSGLKLNLKDRAQDGRFSVVLKGEEIEVRVSVIPGAFGETVVMRLLNPEAISVPFEKLGMEATLAAIVEKAIRSPNGMLLNTGPTGSGKTTTLYACLKKINSPDVKIITIEDPIEYHVVGIVQTQVEKNYTFLSGLRSALRQDPDVIMIGEIRDEEVAKTAIDAALTGHFVFSTIHTNNAAGTFPRLADLGVDPKVFGSAVNIAMAQRLVRVLCSNCKKKVPLAGAQKEMVDRVVAGLRNKTVIPADVTSVYEPVGCAECNNTGYKGRIGVFEALILDDELDKLLRTLPSESDIQAVQKKRELLTMIEDGVIKALTGVTTLAELDRVVELDA